MDMPEIRYAKSGDVRIAYQVAGGGPVDLLSSPASPPILKPGGKSLNRPSPFPLSGSLAPYGDPSQHGAARRESASTVHRVEPAHQRRTS